MYMEIEEKEEQFYYMMSAIRTSNLDDIRILVNEEGVDVNYKPQKAIDTFLMTAVEKGNIEIIEYLLKNGADIHAKDKDDQDVLDSIPDKNRNEVAKLLLEYNLVDSEAYFRNKINNHTFSLFGIAKTMQEIKITFDLTKTIDHISLIGAVFLNQFDTVKFLIKNGVEVNGVTNNRVSALMAAAAVGNKKIIDLLLENSADLKAKDKNGNNLLMHSTFSDNYDNVAFFIKKFKDVGIDVNLTNKFGDTNLIAAAYLCSNTEILKLLLANGADINAQNKVGENPLFLPALAENLEVMKFLLDNGADYKSFINIGRKIYQKMKNHSFMITDAKAIKFLVENCQSEEIKMQLKDSYKIAKMVLSDRVFYGDKDMAFTAFSEEEMAGELTLEIESDFDTDSDTDREPEEAELPMNSLIAALLEEPNVSALEALGAGDNIDSLFS